MRIDHSTDIQSFWLNLHQWEAIARACRVSAEDDVNDKAGEGLYPVESKLGATDAMNMNTYRAGQQVQMLQNLVNEITHWLEQDYSFTVEQTAMIISLLTSLLEQIKQIKHDSLAATVSHSKFV